MRKYIFFLGAIFISGVSFSQVGINTENPKGTFNIDGGKDNPTTGSAHTATQQLNDFTVLQNGNVGVGTINPSQKLEIQTGGTTTDPVTGFKLADGNQGESKVLTSDATGIGTWQTAASMRPTITGTFPTPSNIVRSLITATGVTNTGVYITLPKGKWLVSVGITLGYNIVNSEAWLHAYLTSSTANTITRTNFTHLGPAGVSTAFAGLISNSARVTDLNFMPGSSLINVTQDNSRIYLAIESIGANAWEYNTAAFENYFFAIPIN